MAKHPDGLRSSTLSLQFWLKEDDFTNGKLRVKCRAQIINVYYRETETHVVGEYTLPHKVLQARSNAKRGMTFLK